MLTVGLLFSGLTNDSYLKAMPKNNNMPFEKGYKPSKTTKDKMSISAIKRCTPEWRQHLSDRLSTLLPLKELKTLYEKGMTQDELAIHFNVKQKVIWGFMKRHGIKARKAAILSHLTILRSGNDGE